RARPFDSSRAKNFIRSTTARRRAPEDAEGGNASLHGPRMSATGTEQPGTYSPAKAEDSRPQLKRPPARSVFREYGIPLLLLSVSAITTTANGARFMQNFVE